MRAKPATRSCLGNRREVSELSLCRVAPCCCPASAQPTAKTVSDLYLSLLEWTSPLLKARRLPLSDTCNQEVTKKDLKSRSPLLESSWMRAGGRAQGV